MILVNEDDRDLLIKGLEIGIDEYLMTPLDTNELIARLHALRHQTLRDARCVPVCGKTFLPLLTIV
ncbi:MAG: hypothetical protein H6908_05170 [Hyphomicrobiales bacterium]|nr:hypothetical protein [Hyphomicrobiales bacterium]